MRPKQKFGSEPAAVVEEKMGVIKFGKKLLEANDLDPVYVLVHRSGLSGMDLRRWLLAYWCFYHVGTASWIADGGSEYFWGRMETAAGSKEYPRSTERRHYRGEAAAKSVAWLKNYGIVPLFNELLRAGPTAHHVTREVRSWFGFGDWVSFKVADMIERVGMRPVAFDLEVAIYKGSPTDACRLLWQQKKGRKLEPHYIKWAVDLVLRGLEGYMAPPTEDRPLGVQEAETVLCKWKSYTGGHYHIGEDVAACRKGLEFRPGEISKRLLKAGKGALWRS